MQSNPRGTIQLLAEHAQYITGATGAAVALQIGKETEMVCCASAGITAPPVDSRVEISGSFSGECVRTRQLLRCNSADSDERVDIASCRLLGIASIIVMPLLQGDRVAGLFQILSMQKQAFQDRDVSALKRIGAMIEAMIPSFDPLAAPAEEAQAAAIPQPRRWLRTPIGVQISATTLRSGVPEEIPGRTKDVCEKGMGLVLAGQMAPGEGVIVEFLLPFAQGSIRRRSVVRHQKGLLHGLEFVDEMAEQSPTRQEVRTPLFMLPKILAGHQ